MRIPSLSLSAHGFGTKNDKLFHSLRANIFKGDFLNILLIKKKSNKQIYFLLEKNPHFYTLINETNTTWEKYTNKQLELEKLKLDNKLSSNKLNEYSEKTRQFQNDWRNKLADETVAYTKENKIICPISEIEATRDNFLTLFRASHIKPYSFCQDILEAYDTNNGLLLSANIDALFDKFLISIDENKQLKLSFLFENENMKLLDTLKIKDGKEISHYFLNEKRMKFLSWHYERFLSKEKERKYA